MVQKHGPETSHEERALRHMQVVYARRTRERRIFMEELKEVRKRKDKKIFKDMKDAVGPKWYQALSVPQRLALDTLETSIYQDLLEGRPIRTAQVMHDLGLFPRPNTIDLMNCVYLGRDDPKQMLAQLFLMTYGHPIDGKKPFYCLNARLMLSGILYLGLDNLLHLLYERFKPDKKDKPLAPKKKPKDDTPLASPYLQDMIAVLYLPPKRPHPRPAPLPNLDDLNEPYEEDPVIPKPPPPPPPPPPPKKRLPISYCEKLAGIMRIDPHSSGHALTKKRSTRASHRRLRTSKTNLTEPKKKYGLNLGPRKKSGKRKKLVPPTTGIWNAQYHITGVHNIQGKTVFVLGNVSILPPVGDLIHGGIAFVGGYYINIHCGFRAFPPPPKPDPCDCVKTWLDPVFQHVKTNKCRCGHFYDYGNEGNFSSEELPYFQKATKTSPHRFNFETIYDLDEQQLLVSKEFKHFWETDSILGDGTGTKRDKKKKKRRSSATCLGEKPQPEDYLKCAIRLMRRVNIAARLPEIHLVPELKEWMRRRIYGPYTRIQRAEMLRQSTTNWQMFQTLALRGYGHVAPRNEVIFSGHTNWVHKHDLNEKFREYTQQYKLELYRSHAAFNNLLWPSMCQAQFPDKKFREIFFSYLFSRIDDFQLMHPYSSREATERKLSLARKRYSCPPAGVEAQE